MWGVLFLPDPRNQEKTWIVCINKYRFPLDYVKLYTKGLNLGSKGDKYMV